MLGAVSRPQFFTYCWFMCSYFALAAPQWGTAEAEIKNHPGGSTGLSKVPSFSAWSRNIALQLHNMLCVLLGPLAYKFLHSQFIFLPNLSKQRLAKCLELWKDFDLWFDELCLLFITEMVYWAFKTNYLLTSLAGWWRVFPFSAPPICIYRLSTIMHLNVIEQKHCCSLCGNEDLLVMTITNTKMGNL